MFVNPGIGDYHLQAGSPCIDTGTDTGAPNEDIEGNLRPIDGDIIPGAITDMGAYEFVPPAVEVEAIPDFSPDTLNLISKSKWITAYIELEAGYDVNDIDVSTVMLNDTVPSETKPASIGDYDADGIPDLMVQFDKVELIAYLQGEGVEDGDDVELAVTGEVDGILFGGTDMIRVIFRGGRG
jgi:hypothetical protein